MDEDNQRFRRWLEAARLGDVAAVAEFLDQGMAVDAGVDRPGRTALMKAVGWGRLDVIRLLLDRGADPNLANAEGYSATTFAVAASRNGHGEALSMLLAAGGRRQTLPDAVWSGDVELARSLLDQGADFDLGEYSYHGTMVQIACLLDDLAMVELFLSRGADVEAQDDLGQRPLTIAAKYGYKRIVLRLLDHGADIDAVDWLGMSPLSHAGAKGNRPLYDLLLARGAKRSLFDALDEGDLLLFERLLDEKLGEDGYVDHIYRWSGPRLATYAAGVGNVAALRIALDRGAAFFREDHDDVPLLASAARGEHVGAMELLIARGADLHATGDDGLTPLAWAEKEGREEAAALLRRAGAKR